MLLIDNYLKKWATILEAGEESADTEHAVNKNSTADADGKAKNGRQKKRRTKRLPGKYTEKKVDTANMVGGAAQEWHG